jgi:Ubiquitin-activating enzyme E1 FCCH domain
MTIAYVGAGTLAATYATSAGGTFSTIQPGLPTYSAGNLLLAIVGVRASYTPVTVPAPSGWTELAQTTGTNRQVFLFAKIAGASETAPVIDPTGEDGSTQPTINTPLMAQVFSFSGSFNLDTVGDLVHASITPASNATADWTIESGGSGASTLTITEDNTLALLCWLWTNDGNAQTALTNFTVGDTQYTQLGNDGTIGWQYWIQTTATSVTNQQTTITPVNYKSISNITKANPGQVTTDAAHGFAANELVRITGVAGMTQVNNTNFNITSVDANNFTIGVDTSGYGTYSASGSDYVGATGQNVALMVSIKETLTSGSPLILPHRSGGGMIDLSGNFRG